jgi:hypothetical protein
MSGGGGVGMGSSASARIDSTSFMAAALQRQRQSKGGGSEYGDGVSGGGIDAASGKPATAASTATASMAQTRAALAATAMSRLGMLDTRSSGTKLRGLGHCVFLHQKAPVLVAALAATAGSGGHSTSILLDNFEATNSQDLAQLSPATSRCCFVQAFEQLHQQRTSVLRTVWDHDRVFQLQFKGESGIDAGGVYREGMTSMVEDLFSTHFQLFIPCANAVDQVGTNKDKFVPDPQQVSKRSIEMFEFVGKLVGVSIRANLCLPFQFPPLVWKLLLHEKVGVADLAEIDFISAQLVTGMACCEEEGVCDQSAFEQKYAASQLCFSFTSTDGVERPLPRRRKRRRQGQHGGGASTGAAEAGDEEDADSNQVTFANRMEYCELLVRHRLGEYDEQLAAIARGLGTIVPGRALHLFTWQELEVLVCGKPSLDMEWWMEHTEYQGYAKTDNVITLFWKVLRSLSFEEQCGFIRFAWGRSKLPPRNSWWENMKLQRPARDEAASRHRLTQLPVAHTCFFSIELPAYETEAQMRHGLLTAIHFGAAGVLNS